MPDQRVQRRRLVDMPRHLLSVELDRLPGFGLSDAAYRRLRAYLANLPLLPRATDSRVLTGPPALTTPALMVLARRVGQAYRDHNIGLRDSPGRKDRLRLVYLPATRLAVVDSAEWGRVLAEAGVFVSEASAGDAGLLEGLARSRRARKLPTFVAAATVIRGLRAIELGGVAPG